MKTEPGTTCVFRWKLSPKNTITKILMPATTQILNVVAHHGNLNIFGLVDQDDPAEVERTFGVWRTGKTMPPAKDVVKYIGTINGGQFFHVFELTPTAAEVHTAEKIVTKQDMADLAQAMQTVQDITKKIQDEEAAQPSIDPEVVKEPEPEVDDQTPPGV